MDDLDNKENKRIQEFLLRSNDERISRFSLIEAFKENSTLTTHDLTVKSMHKAFYSIKSFEKKSLKSDIMVIFTIWFVIVISSLLLHRL